MDRLTGLTAASLLLLLCADELVDEIEMRQMHISTYSLAETFDIGRDTGTPVSTLYDDPFVFNTPVDRVIIQVSDDSAHR